MPVVSLAHALSALRPNDELILEQTRLLAELNRCLDVALNNMGRGLSMFDAAARLIVCNKLYREIYALPEELTRPGTPLAAIVRHHVKKETGRDDPEELESQRKSIENSRRRVGFRKVILPYPNPKKRPHHLGEQSAYRGWRVG